MNRPRNPDTGQMWVALVLAIGLAVAINAITIAVLYDAIASAGPGLSENATQVLTTAFGGIIGVLGGFIGYRAGRASLHAETDEDEDDAAAAPAGFLPLREVDPTPPPEDPPPEA